MFQFNHQLHKSVFQLFFFIVVSIFLINCGGSSQPDTDKQTSSKTLSGTAAEGAAIVGTIFVTDSNGTQVSVTINQDGTYSVDVSNLTAPFIISAVPADSSKDTQYSYAAQANITVNVTPLTTLTIWLANNQLDLSALEANWQTQSSSLTAQEISDALAIVMANFSNHFALQGLDASSYDIFTTNFNVNGQGFDGLLDLLTIAIDMAGGNLTVDYSGVDLTFDVNIATNGGSTGGTTDTGAGSTIIVSGAGASVLNDTTGTLLGGDEGPGKSSWSNFVDDIFNMPPTLFSIIIGLNPVDETKAMTIMFQATNWNSSSLEVSEKHFWKVTSLNENFTGFENIPNINGVVITEDTITLTNVVLENVIDLEDGYLFAENIVVNATLKRN